METVEEGATRLNRRLRPQGGGMATKPFCRQHVLVWLSEPGKYGDLLILSTPRADEFAEELAGVVREAVERERR